MVFKSVRALFNSDLYHGWGKSRSFFEGWYFKFVNRNEDRIFAVIPGISMDNKGSSHSFIQVLDGVNLKSEYYRFNFSDFYSNAKSFDIRIGSNHFSATAIRLDLPIIKGELRFSDLVKWPSRWYSPGIMGPYSFVPFMECNHGILSMNHDIRGEMQVDSEKIDFSGGRGYAEKDWGSSFPEAYIWMQSNHFNPDIGSLKISVAKIPWIGSSFIGFIAGLWYKGRIIEFTTYNNSHIRRLEITESKIVLAIENSKYRMEIYCSRPSATKLASPVSGEMSSHIHESMRARIELSLFNREEGSRLVAAGGRNVALEVAGKVEQLIVE